MYTCMLCYNKRVFYHFQFRFFYHSYGRHIISLNVNFLEKVGRCPHCGRNLTGHWKKHTSLTDLDVWYRATFPVPPLNNR